VHHDKNNSPYLSAFLGHFCHIRTTGSYWQLPLTRALLLLDGDVSCWKVRSRFQKDQRGSKSPKPRRSYCLGTTRLLQAWVEQFVSQNLWKRGRRFWMNLCEMGSSLCLAFVKPVRLSGNNKWRALPRPQKAKALVTTFCGRDYGRDVMPLSPAVREANRRN